MIDFISSLIQQNSITIEKSKMCLKFILISKLPNHPNVKLILKKKQYKSNQMLEKLLNDIQNLKEENEFLKNSYENLNKKFLSSEKDVKEEVENKIENKNIESKINQFENRIKILEGFHFIKNKHKIQLKNCNLKNSNSIKSHIKRINSVSSFPSGNIISVSADKSIKIYDIHFNILQNIENAHNDAIAYVEVKDENNFMTCSSDETIKFWTKKLNDFYLNKIIKNAHDAQINKVIYFNNYIISCSKDKSIKFWEEKNESFNCIKNLNDESEINSILCLYDKNTLISSSEDSTKFWDLNNINNLNDNSNILIKDCNCKNANTLVRIDEDNIITNGKDNYVNVISFSKKKIIHEINIFTQCYGVYLVNDKGIFLIGATSNIRIYRKDNFECIQIIKNSHNDDIVGFNELKDGNIISYSADKTIKVWSF
jgi:WD40 repeat protein